MLLKVLSLLFAYFSVMLIVRHRTVCVNQTICIVLFVLHFAELENFDAGSTWENLAFQM